VLADALQLAQRGRFVQEGLEVRLSFDLLREGVRTVARQPADDVVHLLPRAPFHFGLPDVVGIYAGKGSGEDSVLLHGFVGYRRSGVLGTNPQLS
jgi:hypothetical protein